METLIINSKDINKENNFNMSAEYHINKRKEEIKQILNNIPKVEQMNTNQFIIYCKDFTLFQSYNSPIALIKNGITYIFKNYAYSTTTGKYRNQFLNEERKDTEEKLKSGEYIAVDF